MLEPQARLLLLDALKPTPGYEIDFAIGTTYTLDLKAMLAVPLAMSMLDRSDKSGDLASDELTSLEALRRYASRMLVFCGVGEIKDPGRSSALQLLLEKSVVEVEAPKGGVFHPKVWALRMVHPTEPPRYRILCGSRNLTFDRSWDTILILEGEVASNRTNSYGESRDVAAFIECLPTLVAKARGNLDERAVVRIKDIAAELRLTKFAPPDGFESLQFMPLGIPGFGRGLANREETFKRLLVVSPFVDRGIEALAEKSEHLKLVSRIDQLQLLDPQTLRGVEAHYFSDEQPAEETPSADDVQAELDDQLDGLHAKIFIGEAGWGASVWTGSANATAAAFERNVEFLVRLDGRRSACGVDVFLQADQGAAGFSSFLQPFQPLSAQSEELQSKRELEWSLHRVSSAIARSHWSIRFERNQETQLWTIRLVQAPALGDEAADLRTLVCWPITTTPASGGRSIDIGQSSIEACFEGLPVEALTTFMAFRIEIEKGGRTASKTMVLNLPAVGEPPERSAALLRQMLGSQDAIQRYLMLLLDAPRGSAEPGGHDSGWSSLVQGNRAAAGPQSILEPLIRALHREPDRLDTIAELVRDMSQADGDHAIWPANWNEVWSPIWQARQAIRGESRG